MYLNYGIKIFPTLSYILKCFVWPKKSLGIIASWTLQWFDIKKRKI